MLYPKFLSHLRFAKSEQGGILCLVVVLFFLILMHFYVDFETEPVLDINSPEVSLLRKEIDSLRMAEIQARKPNLFPFNPNFITDYKAYSLGMSTAEFDRLKEFREQGKWINNRADFKRVTEVSNQWIDSIAPFFKFPKWVTHPRPSQKRSFKDMATEKTFAQKIDLNQATAQQLQQVSGIGAVLSDRIIKYRNRLNGFTDDIQLYEVYGLQPEVIKNTVKLFTVKTPKPITKLNVNEVSASDLATLPGISFELAKEIWEYVRLREGIKDLSELEQIESITPAKLSRIQLYLSAE